MRTELGRADSGRSTDPEMNFEIVKFWGDF